MIERREKEKHLGQHSKVVWMTGFSGAGKTTLASKLEEELFQRGYVCFVLDGDIVRAGINRNLTFTDADRVENIRRIAEISKLFLESGIITINCFISPTREIRHMAKEIIGREDFIEVYVDAPFSICEERDVKGLYSRARKGEIKDFTGIDSPYEIPENPDLIIPTSGVTINDSVNRMLEYLLPMIELKNDQE